MRLFWSTLVVLAFTGVHSSNYSSEAEVLESLIKVEVGEDLYTIYKHTNETLIEVQFTGGNEKSYSDFISDLRRTNPLELRVGLIRYKYTEKKMPTHMLVLIVLPPKQQSSEKDLVVARLVMDSYSKLGNKVAQFVDTWGLLIATKDEDLVEETLLSRLTIYSSTGASESEGETTTHAVKVSE